VASALVPILITKALIRKSHLLNASHVSVATRATPQVYVAVFCVEMRTADVSVAELDNLMWQCKI
jgi:hypothetical protein